MVESVMDKPVQILLVEDNIGDVVITKRALDQTSFKHELAVVENGELALSYLRREGSYASANVPDLVLLDISLPRVDGLEVLRQIKEDEKLRIIPVVMLTGSRRESDVTDAYQNYANSYITKVFDSDKFTELIQSLEQYWFAIVERPKLPN